VVLDQEAHRLALIAIERDALDDLVEHARADLGVTVEVHAVGAWRSFLPPQITK
jgi:hypothetical protein